MTDGPMPGMRRPVKRTEPPTPGLFQAWGIEMEYMVVDRDTLRVKPIVDELFERVAGAQVNAIDRTPVAWSNELAAHVVELKNPFPASSWKGLAGDFQASVSDLNRLLAPMDARLMPSGMHPLMNPLRETRLWPRGDMEIYGTFNRIFDCRGHGWSNLQSAHLNLSFRGDDEFHRLHSAIRMVLPLLPALAASSPFQEGESTGFLDTRLENYRRNCLRVPQVTGQVIPEVCASEEEYREKIFKPMRRAMTPHDPDGILEEIWLNARGAIARFDRGSIEIRLCDSQEGPAADLAVLSSVAALVRALVETGDRSAFDSLDSRELAEVLLGTIRHGENAPVRHEGYLRALGAPPGPAGPILRSLMDRHRAFLPELDSAVDQAREQILGHGTLATRLIARDREKGLPATYAHLADCMASGGCFPAS